MQSIVLAILISHKSEEIYFWDGTDINKRIAGKEVLQIDDIA